MKLKDLEHISTPDTPKKGENNSYLSDTEVNLINIPDNSPKKFPQNFPDTDTNNLEINNEIKSVNQYFPKVSLRFYLHNAKSVSPTHILVYLRIDGMTYKHNSNLKVLPQDWNKETQTAIISDTQSDLTQQNNILLNNVINRLKIWRCQIYTYICNQTSRIDATEFNEMLDKMIKSMTKNNKTKGIKPKEKVKEYFNVIRALRKQADKKNDSTANEYNKRITNLENYLRDNKLSDNLYDFDYKTVFNYKEYLNKSEQSYTRCKVILRTIKTLTKEIGNDPNYGYDYDPKIENLEIDPNKEKRSLADKQETQIVLSDEQINTLATLELSDEKEKQVRDIFLLQVYTACRHSDLPKLLDTSNLIEIEGKEYIRYMDKKEGNRKSKLNYVNAPLFFYPNAKILWQKLTSNPIIINITDTNYFNRMLKRIAKKSGDLTLFQLTLMHVEKRLHNHNINVLNHIVEGIHS